MSHADNRPKFYLTTPIYYANARPHVGSAYTTLVADTIARFKRMQGYDVAFLTGTDEHGANITRAAAKAGVTPREHVDRYSAVFRNLWNELGISYTHFIRTTSPEHLRAVRRLLLRARDAGYIYKGAIPPIPSTALSVAVLPKWFRKRITFSNCPLFKKSS